MVDASRALPNEAWDPLGSTVGKYDVLREIGSGGMGRVYEGIHREIGKRVALKFVDPELLGTDAIERFSREAQAASSVESAHIVQVFDVGSTDDGHPFLVMELLRGEDLGQRIRRDGRLELDDALDIGAQILRGLARAHEAGIVHRDLKPENVFLVERDDHPAFVKILDFGVSKIRAGARAAGGSGARGISATITREGVVVGTPLYMSPEQAQGLPGVDARSDLFSVGAILYECLTGRPPHSGGSYEQVIVAICSRDADDARLHNPLVTEPIARVLQRALAREVDERHQSANELLDELVAASEGRLVARPGLSKSSGAARTVVTPPGPRHGDDGNLDSQPTVAATPAVALRQPEAESRGRSRWLWLGAAVAASIGVALLVGAARPGVATTASAPAERAGLAAGSQNAAPEEPSVAPGQGAVTKVSSVAPPASNQPIEPIAPSTSPADQRAGKTKPATARPSEPRDPGVAASPPVLRSASPAAGATVRAAPTQSTAPAPVDLTLKLE
jgi:eukaryotic-like serine/threonine-protein kinase